MAGILGLNRLRHIIRNIERKTLAKKSKINKLDLLHIKNIEYYDFVNKKLMFCQTELETLIEKLKVYNFHNLIRLIDHEWYPKTPFETLRQYFTEILYNYDIPILEHEQNTNVNEDKSRLDADLFNMIENNLKNNSILFNNILYSFSYKALIHLMMNNFNTKFFALRELSDVFLFVLSVQSEKLSRMKITNDNDFSLQSFLINESLSDNDINNFEYNYHLKRLNIHRDFRESFIVDFYSSFCKAQARLLDLDDDFSFLIFIIEKAIIETAETNDIIFPYIQDILNKVIVNKSISHSKAREEAQKGFINANYMTEFQNVLCNVIKAWEI